VSGIGDIRKTAGLPGTKGLSGPEDLMAPCGCVLLVRTVEGERVVTLVPHDLNCPMVQASIDVAEWEGKEVNLVEHP
jgi:hypothetical protein